MSLLSVIVPCYNEEESVALFYRELTKNDPFFKEKEIELELLYIDDGSKDGTVREVKKLIQYVTRAGPHGGSGHSCGNRNGWITCGCNL